MSFKRHCSPTTTAIEIGWLPVVFRVLEHLQIDGLLLAHCFEAIYGLLYLVIQPLERRHVGARLALWLLGNDCGHTRQLGGKGTAANFILIDRRSNILHVIGSSELNALIPVVGRATTSRQGHP
mgnify:CR=1 FL=1